jgi:hypothetical protein
MLGRDRRKAEAANARLELLWDVVEEHHATHAAARPAYLQPAEHDTPLWAGTELEIAEAVRLGQQVIQVGIHNEMTHIPAGYASLIATRIAYVKAIAVSRIGPERLGKRRPVDA